MDAMLASDAIFEKVKFPCIIQPKIDGVRALNMDGNLTGRSKKRCKNQAVTDRYSKPEYIGFDGEMVCEAINHPDLCRITTSALSTINGEPWTIWHIFDYVTSETAELPYIDRLARATVEIEELHRKFPETKHIIRIIPFTACQNLEALERFEQASIDYGFEGIIIRDPNGKHKQGRSTATEGGLLRVKRFKDAEAWVVSLEEGQTNNNEAQTNELGKTFRTSHKANKEPNGQIGALICRTANGEIIKVAAGCMPHDDRVKYFNDQNLIIGKPIKYKFFPHGVKDKPRFPTFQSIRMESDH